MLLQNTFHTANKFESLTNRRFGTVPNHDWQVADDQKQELIDVRNYFRLSLGHRVVAHCDYFEESIDN